MARRGGRAGPMTTGSWTVNTRAATAVRAGARTSCMEGEVAVGSIVEE
uniref:Uncharacterized protein n=1 Tax=Oryza sativa subsp. japonica TaxID=39947 RepID=Q851W8_ORYSJ|nr:hypothetical protein [Oryza sativa Japonica Group]